MILTFVSNAICVNFRGDFLDESLNTLHEKGYSRISGIFSLETTQKLVNAIDSILETENDEDGEDEAHGRERLLPARQEFQRHHLLPWRLREDLDARRLRVLHPGSFRDDPTRARSAGATTGRAAGAG